MPAETTGPARRFHQQLSITTLELPAQNKRFGRFIARRLWLARRDDFELMLELFHYLTIPAAMKTFDQQSAIRLQMTLREVQRQIAQMFHSRCIRAGNS